ncbi:MAG: glycosyltransferase family 2 protein [Chitinophagaceae bacterium]
MDISVVIITKNEAHIIEKTLQSLQGEFHDIVVVDSGSTDDTVSICKKYNVHVIETTWDGYGSNKNKGIDVAKNDWILSLDADEALDDELKKSLLQIHVINDEEVFNIRRKNFFNNKWIRFGEWGFDNHLRLFNRKKIRWNNDEVHEKLILPNNYTITNLTGYILHYTVQSLEEFVKKNIMYARLNAIKYAATGKKSNFIKQYLSPVFSFLRNYIFRLGFLDGWEGFIIAKYNAYYTFLKYKYLADM